jgi:hypothetical protein
MQVGTEETFECTMPKQPELNPAQSHAADLWKINIVLKKKILVYSLGKIKMQQVQHQYYTHFNQGEHKICIQY